MHIAMFTDYYLPTPGGIQTSVKAQKEALEKAGHRVTVFCPINEPSDDPSIIQLPTLKYIKPNGFPVAGTAKKVIYAAIDGLKNLKDVSIVHVHSDLAAGVAGLIAAHKLGIPSVQSMHGREDVYVQKILPMPAITSYYFTQLHNRYISHGKVTINPDGHNISTVTARRVWRLMVSHANYADSVIVPSSHFARKLQQHGVVKPLTVISNGIEPSVLKRLKPVVPRNLDNDGKLIIMWCGRISPEKRPLEFLEAVRYFPVNVEVNMYGDGPIMSKARRLVARYNLQGKVKFHGIVSQDQVLFAMKNSHLFACTSYDFDNQPMVLIEAVAAGLPVMYCDPDMSEVVPPKGSVVTSSPQPIDIAKTVQDLMANPEKIREMSLAMIAYRKHISQLNHLGILVKTYERTIAAYDD